MIFACIIGYEFTATETSVVHTELGLCLGWKGQCICCVTRGGRRVGGREREEGEGREGRDETDGTW